MEAFISGFQLFMYVHAFCMHGNVHECVCGLGLASLMHLCRDWAALPSCVPGPGRAAAVACISGHTLTHSVYTLHCPYTSSGFSPLSWVTNLTSLNMKIIKGQSIPGFNFFRHSPELHLIISRTKK